MLKNISFVKLLRIFTIREPHPKWMIFGDFNLILNSSEKLGGNNIDYHHTNMFNTTLNECDLNDLGFFGSKYTWANNQSDMDHIKERLDRFCANTNWILSFPRYTNKHLLKYSSDHNPIMLDFYSTGECYIKHNHKKLIIFEQPWAQDAWSNTILKTAWNNTQSTNIIKLQHTLDHLYAWGRNKFGDLANKIKIIQTSLDKLKTQVPSQDCIKQIKVMETTLDEYLKQEELWWAQRAKVHWLEHGDQNTKIFHYKASQRKRKNTITSIQDPDGNSW